MDDRIEIVVNGRTEHVPPRSTVASLVERFEGRATPLVVELNGRFVFPGDYRVTVVGAGDHVEMILPAFGG